MTQNRQLKRNAARPFALLYNALDRGPLPIYQCIGVTFAKIHLSVLFCGPHLFYTRKLFGSRNFMGQKKKKKKFYLPIELHWSILCVSAIAPLRSSETPTHNFVLAQYKCDSFAVFLRGKIKKQTIKITVIIPSIRLILVATIGRGPKLKITGIQIFSFSAKIKSHECCSRGALLF